MTVQDVEGWKYYPAIDGQVVGHLAVAPATAPSTSFKYVWWQRGANETYSMTGIKATSLTDAACKVRAIVGSAGSLFFQTDFGDGAAIGEGCAGCQVATTMAPVSESIVSTNLGIDVDDPVQLIIDELEPADIEFLVEEGVSGAVTQSLLAGQASTDPSAAAVGATQMDDRLKWITWYAQTLQDSGRAHDVAVSNFPVYVLASCSTVTVNQWQSEFACTGRGGVGACKYNGTASDITCCQGPGGVITCTTVTRAISRVCAGACSGTTPPRPGCR